jgi:hypothetical protein
MSFEFFENEAMYVSKSEISQEAKAKISKRLSRLTVMVG